MAVDAKRHHHHHHLLLLPHHQHLPCAPACVFWTEELHRRQQIRFLLLRSEFHAVLHPSGEVLSLSFNHVLNCVTQSLDAFPARLTEFDAVLLLPLLPFPLPLHLPLPLPLPLPSSFLVIKMKSRQPVEG